MSRELPKPITLNSHFKKGIAKITELSKQSRYQSAFIFGSVAEGTSNAKSDLDVKVIVDEDNPCENINHPTFDDYKLDITFRSFKQIRAFTEDEIKKGEREPNLARGVIVFDKTGELTKLQNEVRSIAPQKYTEKDYQFVQFMLYHANNKVERFLKDDPIASLYSMHANIGEVLKIHFKLNGKWWVSSKNVLKNLEGWDKQLAELVRHFVSTADVTEKYTHWSAIIDHVTKPMGGRQPISENNCDCAVCKQDLATLAGQ
jgi:predicted nucleotidyltransferase